jgi:acylphosphatase
VSGTRRFLVRGRVQGVAFRASTVEVARQLGLSGHARNLDDGSVEVVCVGAAAQVEALARWLQQGPPLAQVASVASEDWGAPVEPGFTIRR